MKRIELKLPLIEEITLYICNNELAEFTQRQLYNYVVNIQELKENNTATTIILATNQIFIKKMKPLFTKNQKLGRQYKIDNNILNIPNFEYHLSNEALEIIYTKKEKIKWYKGKKKATYSKCHINFYEQILFPIFSLYAIYDGYYLIHGSLLMFNDNAFILSGLDGVGKSSLSNLLQQKGAKILADNFVLYNGKTAIPLNMAMRLEPKQDTQLEVLYSDKDLKEVLPIDILDHTICVNKIFLLSISDKLEFKKISNNPVLWSLFLNLAPEIGSANNFIAPVLYNSLEITKLDFNGGFFIIKIPLGELEKGLEVLLNEC